MILFKSKAAFQREVEAEAERRETEAQRREREWKERQRKMEEEYRERVRICDQIAREQLRQAKELAQHEARLAKHEEQIEKLEQRLTLAEGEISFAREQRERLFKLLDIEELELTACVEGGKEWQKHQRKIIALNNQIHSVQLKLDKAKMDKHNCQRKLGA